MPLPSIRTTSTASPSRRLYDRVLDAESHLDQHLLEVVQSTDGFLYLANRSMRTHEVDVEPFPSLSPQSHVAPSFPLEAGSDAVLDRITKSRIARLDDSLASFGLQDIADATTGRRKQLLTPAHLIGPHFTHPFQVVWLGSRREWCMNKGLLNKREESLELTEHPISRTVLQGEEGWIGIPCDIAPLPTTDPDSLAGYSITFGRPTLVPEVVQVPPERTISPQLAVTWSRGAQFLPIAWVSPPRRSRRAPRIYPLITNDVEFGALWNGTWFFTFNSPF